MSKSVNVKVLSSELQMTESPETTRVPEIHTALFDLYIGTMLLQIYCSHCVVLISSADCNCLLQSERDQNNTRIS